MDAVTSQAQLTEVKKRSGYSCPLAEAPSWQEKFGQKIDRFGRAQRSQPPAQGPQQKNGL